MTTGPKRLCKHDYYEDQCPHCTQDTWASRDRPDLVPDLDVLACRRSGFTGAYHITMWGWFWSCTLGRTLTLEETWEIFHKLHTGPVRWEDTWEYACEQAKRYRTEHPDACFWRSRV